MAVKITLEQQAAGAQTEVIIRCARENDREVQQVIALLELQNQRMVDMVIAFLQVWILNEQTDYSRSIFFGRSVLWLAIAVVLTIGASIFFGWFEGLPIWCNLLLGVFMLFGLSATLFGLKFEQEQDTMRLNKNLQSYQQKND